MSCAFDLEHYGELLDAIAAGGYRYASFKAEPEAGTVLLRHDVDLQDAAMNVLDFLHIDPDRRLAGMFIDAAGKVMDWNVIFVGVGAFAYSALRFIEAYGLWCERVWAEWLAIISGSLYIPMEVIELVRHATPIRWGLLIINLIVVAYIAWVRYDEHMARQHPSSAANAHF